MKTSLLSAGCKLALETIFKTTKIFTFSIVLKLQIVSTFLGQVLVKLTTHMGPPEGNDSFDKIHEIPKRGLSAVKKGGRTNHRNNDSTQMIQTSGTTPISQMQTNWVSLVNNNNRRSIHLLSSSSIIIKTACMVNYPSISHTWHAPVKCKLPLILVNSQARSTSFLSRNLTSL